MTVNKIFLIGFNKCGTTTLTNFLKKNNIVSAHYQDQSNRYIAYIMNYNLKNNKPLLTSLEKYQSVSDMTYMGNGIYLEMNKYFKLLDEQYPNSRFILNIRPVDKWIESRSKHFNRTVGGFYIDRYCSLCNISRDEAKDEWKRNWWNHYQEVTKYFQNTGKLIIFDIEKDPLENLVDFFKKDNIFLDPKYYNHLNKTK